MKLFSYTLLFLSLPSGGRSRSVAVSALSSSSSPPPPQQQQTSPPPWKPSPCNRICRYNANVYDGEVCIGCFRDTYEISQWSRMTPEEKAFALEDAADRLATVVTSARTSSTVALDGSVSEDELLRQAEGWRSWTATRSPDGE